MEKVQDSVYEETLSIGERPSGNDQYPQDPLASRFDLDDTNPRIAEKYFLRSSLGNLDSRGRVNVPKLTSKSIVALSRPKLQTSSEDKVKGHSNYPETNRVRENDTENQGDNFSPRKIRDLGVKAPPPKRVGDYNMFIFQ